MPNSTKLQGESISRLKQRYKSLKTKEARLAFLLCVRETGQEERLLDLILAKLELDKALAKTPLKQSPKTETPEKFSLAYSPPNRQVARVAALRTKFIAMRDAFEQDVRAGGHDLKQLCSFLWE